MAGDYSKVFETYKRLPPDIKRKFDAFSAERYVKGSPPPEQMQRDLEAIVEEYKTGAHTKSEIEHATRTVASGRLKPALGLAAILAGIAIFAGMPYMPPPLY